MKRFLSLLLIGVLCGATLCTDALAQELLIPGGQVIGLELSNDTVTVAAFDDGSGARDCGLRIGDEIISVNGKKVRCAEDVRVSLSGCEGEISVVIRRNGREQKLMLRPDTTEGTPRLGVYLRQGITGIGTVTYYDPDSGEFGTLGHGVNDGNGRVVSMTRGQVYPAWIQSVKKGKAGQPGQLKGSADPDQVLGKLDKNTPQGVFGQSRRGWMGEALPVAEFEEVRTGKAVIRSTVTEAGPREYSVEILKIYPKDRSDCRNFLLKVTDPDLLAITGGIVQGMSGSPIIQDGKLVGAVTHVLVNDPTCGYGIFIENMLDAAA